MNIGISPEAASINSTPLESTSAPAAAGAPTNAPAAFGQWMAQALQAQKQAQEQVGQPPTTDTGETLLDTDTADTSGEKAESEPSLPGDAAAWMFPNGLPAWVGMPHIQQVSVGPSMLAITGASAAPDASSLQAFAQQQGLGAEAIAWLMNPTGVQAPSPAAASPALAQATQATHNPLVTPTATLNPLNIQAATLSSPDMQAPMLNPLATPVTSLTDPTGQAQIISASSDPAALAARAADTARTSAAAVLAALGLSAASGAQSVSVQSAPVAPGGLPPEAQNMATAAAVLAGLRGAFNGQPATKSTTNPTSPQSPQTAPSWSTSELDLSAVLLSSDAAEPDPNDPQAPAEQAKDPFGTTVNAFNRSAPSAPQPRTEASAPLASLGSDQLQQLSEKMADAIGERMLRELERGQWNMRLMLKPAHLGHIEVEMRLRGGELDATFAAPLAGTRDLLQDGLSRLRDNLANAGMDVASLHVKTGQNRQNGGDSTPGQRKFTNNTNNVSTPETAVAPVESAPRPGRADGWDVMV